MYNRHYSAVGNQRSKGLKTKHIVQLCLLLAVCFWLLFQFKRSHGHDNNNHFDATAISHDETLKFGRKDLHPNLEETATQIQMPQQQEDVDDEENIHDEKDQDEDKIEDGGGGGDDEIDEKSNMEFDRDEVDIIDDDDDKETEEENEDKDAETESRVEDDGSTHEAREEHYRADDASSAVISHNPENGTLDDNSSHDEENPNSTALSSGYQFDSNATQKLSKSSGMLKSNGEEESENLGTNNEDPTHLELQNDLQTLPEIQTDTTASE